MTGPLLPPHRTGSPLEVFAPLLAALVTAGSLPALAADGGKMSAAPASAREPTGTYRFEPGHQVTLAPFDGFGGSLVMIDLKTDPVASKLAPTENADEAISRDLRRREPQPILTSGLDLASTSPALQRACRRRPGNFDSEEFTGRRP